MMIPFCVGDPKLPHPPRNLLQFSKLVNVFRAMMPPSSGGLQCCFVWLVRLTRRALGLVRRRPLCCSRMALFFLIRRKVGVCVFQDL